MARQALGAALVGFGYWGPNLARNLSASADFDLLHICDLSPGRVAAARGLYPAVDCGSDASHAIGDDAVDAVLTPAQVVGLQDRVERVLVHRDLEDYVLRLLAATRTHPRLRVGISPRGGQALVRSAKARAVLADRDHVIPDDIRHLAPRVLTHRLVLAEDPRDTLSLQAEARAILDGILATADLPL